MAPSVAIRDLPTERDLERISLQLGRSPRQVEAVCARCTDEWPAVVATQPRLDDGTPFPTLYYLTCRQLNSSLSTLESEGLMRDYALLLSDADVAAAYQHAHESYLEDRNALMDVPEVDQVSAGGMPDRVKCLHALVAHSLAKGPGVNPIGDLALGELVARGLWPHPSPCVSVEAGESS